MRVFHDAVVVSVVTAGHFTSNLCDAVVVDRLIIISRARRFVDRSQKRPCVLDGVLMAILVYSCLGFAKTGACSFLKFPLLLSGIPFRLARSSKICAVVHKVVFVHICALRNFFARIVVVHGHMTLPVVEGVACRFFVL